MGKDCMCISNLTPSKSESTYLLDCSRRVHLPMTQTPPIPVLSCSQEDLAIQWHQSQVPRNRCLLLHHHPLFVGRRLEVVCVGKQGIKDRRKAGSLAPYIMEGLDCGQSRPFPRGRRTRGGSYRQELLQAPESNPKIATSSKARLITRSSRRSLQRLPHRSSTPVPRRQARVAQYRMLIVGLQVMLYSGFCGKELSRASAAYY